uniref:Uncharacterized protein n=1 Tax=Sphaerodactylus townsendi TaxID=933632 RepID=A0ACB8F791_9SAUR
MEKDGGSCSAHDTGGGGEGPAERKEEAQTGPELGHIDAKGVKESPGYAEEPSHAGEGSSVDPKTVEKGQDRTEEPSHVAAGGEGSGDAVGAEENQGPLDGTQKKQSQLLPSLSCPAALQRPEDVPEEAPSLLGPADLPEAAVPPAAEGHAPGEPEPARVPNLTEGPAEEQPKQADKEAGRTLAPEDSSAEAQTPTSSEEPSPATQPLCKTSEEDTAAPVEAGSPVAAAPTSPYLMPDFAKEDPSLVLGKPRSHRPL